MGDIGCPECGSTGPFWESVILYTGARVVAFDDIDEPQYGAPLTENLNLDYPEIEPSGLDDRFLCVGCGTYFNQPEVMD